MAVVRRLVFGAGLMPSLARARAPQGPRRADFVIGNYPVEATPATRSGQGAGDRRRPAGGLSLAAEAPRARHGLRRLGDQASQATGLIDSFSVRSERNSPTQYIASHDFSFQAEAVRQLLDAEGIPFLDKQAPHRHRAGLSRRPTAEAVVAGARPRGRRRGGPRSRIMPWHPCRLQPLKTRIHGRSARSGLGRRRDRPRTLASAYQGPRRDRRRRGGRRPQAGHLAGRDAAGPLRAAIASRTATLATPRSWQPFPFRSSTAGGSGRSPPSAPGLPGRRPFGEPLAREPSARDPFRRPRAIRCTPARAPAPFGARGARCR